MIRCSFCGKDLYKNPSGHYTLCHTCNKQFCVKHISSDVHGCRKTFSNFCYTCESPATNRPCGLCNEFYCSDHITSHGHVVVESKTEDIPMCDFFHCDKPAFSKTGRCLAHGNRVMFK